MISQDIAELISLALTFPVLVLSVWVVYTFGNAALKCAFEKEKTPIQWFTIGVVIGFVGTIFDNFYWMIPWTTKFLKTDNADLLVDLGVYFNIPFRQVCGMAAAYCHIRCAITYSENGFDEKQTKTLRDVFWISMTLGLIFVLFLMSIR